MPILRSFVRRGGRAGQQHGDETKEENSMTHIPPPPLPTPSGTEAGAVSFDWTEWLPYIAEMDATEAEKRQLIETLWSIVLGFVDLGFAVKTPPETRGQVPDLRAELARAVLYSKETEGEHDAEQP